MSVVAYNQSENLTSRQTDLTLHQDHAPQHHGDPIGFLFSLEREMEMFERRTASLMEGLARQLDTLEDEVAKVSGRFKTINRELEKAVTALAHRINSMKRGSLVTLLPVRLRFLKRELSDRSRSLRRRLSPLRHVRGRRFRARHRLPRQHPLRG